MVTKKSCKIIAIDPEKCTGCHCCEMGCSIEHFDKCGPNYSRIRVQEFRDINTFIPIICQLCEDAACISHCPVNARIRLDNGAVKTDEDRCIRCHSCLFSCKFGAITINPETNFPMSCDLCTDNPDGPCCVRVCEMQKALRYVDENEYTTEKSRAWAKTLKDNYGPVQESEDEEKFDSTGYGFSDSEELK
jgi:Fe-S-cluster-containing hydrogenase component 2